MPSFAFMQTALTFQSWLMGRQMAGHGFLRAAVKRVGGALRLDMAYRFSRRRHSPLWCKKLMPLSLCG